MKLRERYHRLTFFNKLEVIGALASIVGIILTVVIYFVSSGNIDKNLSEEWNGLWEHTSASLNGTVKGSMKLYVTEERTVIGSYTSNAPSEGTLEGKIIFNGDRIEGIWKNKQNQSGRFEFDLGADTISFKGYFSISSQRPGKNPSNFWNGTKISNLTEVVEELNNKHDNSENTDYRVINNSLNNTKDPDPHFQIRNGKIFHLIHGKEIAWFENPIGYTEARISKFDKKLAVLYKSSHNYFIKVVNPDGINNQDWEIKTYSKYPQSPRNLTWIAKNKIRIYLNSINHPFKIESFELEADGTYDLIMDEFNFLVQVERYR